MITPTLRSTAQKIFIFSAIFSFLIYSGSNAINAATEPEGFEYPDPNAIRYQQIDVPVLSNVWVAIATNIGTDFKNSNNGGSVAWWAPSSTGAASFNDILEIWDIIDNPDLVRTSFIQTNMLTIQEYLAYLRNDLKADLAWASDKSAFLDNYISQLEIRFKTATNNTNNLIEQRAYLQWVITEADANIENIKLKLDSDFKAFDDQAVMIDVENYLEQSKIKRTAYTYYVFTNKFIEQYDFLNNYNKELLDVLILNKKAISTESFVVIPDSGRRVLQDFNLLYDESVFKAQQEEQ